VYQAANCRIFYTLANVYNLDQLWHDAATAAWDDDTLCVEDSTGYPSAVNATSSKTAPKPPSNLSSNLDYASIPLPPSTPSTALLISDVGDPVSHKAGEFAVCTIPSKKGNKECKPMKIHCGTEKVLKTVNALLSPCVLANEDGDCAGHNVRCKPMSAKDTKAHKSKVNKKRFDGFCKTSVGTVTLCAKATPLER
jgi:hypothetical protein